MDTKTIKGMIIRGAFAMAPVNEIFFKPRKDNKGDGLGTIDEFQGAWDDLPPCTKEQWARLAELLEAAIESPLWKQTRDPDNVQQLIERYQLCTSKLLALFPSDPLGDSPAHFYIERLEALIEQKLLVPPISNNEVRCPNCDLCLGKLRDLEE